MFVVFPALAAFARPGPGSHRRSPHAATAGRTGACGSGSTGSCRAGPAHRFGTGSRTRTRTRTSPRTTGAAGSEPGTGNPATAITTTTAAGSEPATGGKARSRHRTHTTRTEPSPVGVTPPTGGRPCHATGVQP